MLKKLASPVAIAGIAIAGIAFVASASNAAPPAPPPPSKSTPSANLAKSGVYPDFFVMPPLPSVFGSTGLKSLVLLYSISPGPGARPIAYGVPYGNLMTLAGDGMGDAPLDRRLVLVANGRRIPLIVSVWSMKRLNFFAPTIDAMGQSFPGGPMDATLEIESKAGVLATLGGVRFGANLQDADRDGHRNAQSNGDDCDDFDHTRYPGRAEVPDIVGHDEDCDATTFGCRDADNDRWCDARSCNVDGYGRALCGDDCDDGNPSIHPAQVDVCNGRDDNCNRFVDEGLIGCPTTPH